MRALLILVCLVACGCGQGAPVEPMRLRYYDLKDLEVSLGLPIGREIVLVPASSGPPDSLAEPPEPPALADERGERLIDRIQSALGGPAAWASPAWLECRNSILIARNTPAQLARIQHLLDTWRANAGQAVPTVSGAPRRK